MPLARRRDSVAPAQNPMHVNDLLKIAVESGASDLHLKAGSYPMMRVRGTLTPAIEDKRLDHDDMVSIAAAVLPTGHREKFKENHEVDLAYSVAGLGRFRCNTFQQRGTDRHDLPRHSDAGARRSTSWPCRRC